MMVFEAEGGNIITYIISGGVVGYILYSFIKAKRRMNRPASENVKILDDANFDTTDRKSVV